MLDLKLTEIFGVLGVGIFVVITIVYFYFLAQKLFNIRRHNKDAFISWLKGTLSGDYKDTGYAIISGLIVYSAGLLMQDITDHMTDSDTNLNPVISFVKQTNLLDNEGELRKAVLIEDGKKLTGLGKEIFSKARFILKTDSAEKLDFFDEGMKPQQYWSIHGDSICKLKKDLTGFVNRLYYTCKNWCYLEAQPVHKELDDIQERIDFSRSIAIMAFLAMLGILLLYIVYYAVELFFKKKNSRFKVVLHLAGQPAQKNNVAVRRVSRRVFHPLRALLILGCITYAASVCYSAAEKNFNERAMGYYVSQIKFAKK